MSGDTIDAEVGGVAYDGFGDFGGGYDNGGGFVDTSTMDPGAGGVDLSNNTIPSDTSNLGTIDPTTPDPGLGSVDMTVTATPDAPIDTIPSDTSNLGLIDPTPDPGLGSVDLTGSAPLELISSDTSDLGTIAPEDTPTYDIPAVTVEPSPSLVSMDPNAIQIPTPFTGSAPPPKPSQPGYAPPSVAPAPPVVSPAPPPVSRPVPPLALAPPPAPPVVSPHIPAPPVAKTSTVGGTMGDPILNLPGGPLFYDGNGQYISPTNPGTVDLSAALGSGPTSGSTVTPGGGISPMLLIALLAVLLILK